jgi:hypothetical protein
MLRRTAARKGIRGGDRFWFSMWIGLAGLQVIRRVVRPKPVVERFELRPGETVLIADLGTLDQP